MEQGHGKKFNEDVNTVCICWFFKANNMFGIIRKDTENEMLILQCPFINQW